MDDIGMAFPPPRQPPMRFGDRRYREPDVPMKGIPALVIEVFSTSSSAALPRFNVSSV